MNSFTHDLEGIELSPKMQEFVWSQFLERLTTYSKRKEAARIVQGLTAIYGNSSIIGEDTRRIYIRINNILVKISRSPSFPDENRIEDKLWDLSIFNPEYRKLLNPVLYMTENARILLMPYVMCYASTSATDHLYKSFESRVMQELDLYLTYPQGTAYDNSLIVHYPYVNAYPKGFKRAP